MRKEELVRKTGETLTNIKMIDKPKKEYNLTGKDGIWMLCILVLYGIISFINLGSFINPQSFWEPNKEDERITLDFGKVVSLGRARYYCGARFGKFELRSSTDNLRYDYMEDLEEKAVFFWQDMTFEDESMRYLTITAKEPYAFMGEIQFYDKEGEILPVTVLSGSQAIVDEPSSVPEEISYLNSTYFDEIYHARTAYEYIHGLDIYEYTHPPLGKLIMTVPIRAFGMNTFSYRLMGNIAGMLLLLVMYVFAKRIFGSTRYAALGMILFAAEGMHFVQTRIGTVDSFLVLFMFLAFLFMYQYISMGTEASLGGKYLNLLASGAFMGMAIATKWNGAYCGFGLAAIFFADLILRGKKANSYGNWRSQRRCIILWCFVCFIFIPIAIYLLSYIPFFLSDGGKGLKEWWALQQRMLRYHAELNATHPFTSPWYLWPLGIKPVWYYDGKVAEGMVSSIALHSNPIIWWVGIVGMIYACKEVIVERSKAYSFLIVAILSVYLPYAFVPRIMFLYHYFPVVPLMILCLVGFIKMLDTKTRRPAYIWFSAVSIAAFAFFYPIYSGLLVPEWYAFLTQWLPCWQLY